MEFMINLTFGNRSNIKEILWDNYRNIIKSDETPPRATSPKVSDLVIRTSYPIRKEVRLRCDFQSTNGLQLIQVANKIKPYNLKVEVPAA